MLPTFIIGLREGLEAALIVGIVAAFLKRQGREDALKLVWIGVAIAVLLCLGVAITLQIVSAELPQAKQEGLETVVGLIAVAMVTYMILWMRKHSREMKAHLESAAGSALAEGSAMALVFMAFLAVLREGFETAVFLLATFNASGNAAASAAGAVLGVGVACVLGYAIYRGGAKINMRRFFLITSILLVIVAGGLLMTAAHTAHEAGWLNSGQTQAFDLSWLVHPGTVVSSMVTGVFGIQPYPTVVEVVVWLAYVVPMLLIVCWPARTPSKGVGVPAVTSPMQAQQSGRAVISTN